MLTLIGAAMVGGTSAAFWYLLPRDGKENPLVANTGVGSMATIVILTFVIVGIALLCEGLFG